MVGQHERKKRFVLIIALGIRQFGSLTPFCSISVLMCNDLTCPPFFWVSFSLMVFFPGPHVVRKKCIICECVLAFSVGHILENAT